LSPFNTVMKKENYTGRKEVLKLIIASVIIGIACAVLGDSLKLLSDNYETKFYLFAKENWGFYFIFPLIGLSAIYILRQTVFRKRENKGITEIFNTIKTRHNELPVYKIPSHYVNGLLTVIFGGSSGIEVSTVVAAAAVGSTVHNKGKIHHLFRKELIGAGVAAAVTVLFGSPLAGLLFAYEVILKKITRYAILSVSIASVTAWGFNFVLNSEPLFHIGASHWNYYALPYFIALGALAGLNSVYLTQAVLFFKSLFLKIKWHSAKIISGSVIIGVCLLFFPQLYGDGYHAMRELFDNPQHIQLTQTFLFITIGILILKPIITATTLASGGDGGVFAPSLFIGVYLGLLVVIISNTYFDANLIIINFMVVGMAAVLSGSLHAPLTAVFLVCGLTGNFTLMLPLMLTCLISKATAKIIINYTVYSYRPVPV
jgi:CIC family chloride channel protein